MSQPNILIFMPDQLRADAVGAFGGSAHTPVIDGLAAGGTLFGQAFAQSTVCSPSRVSIFTGWYPHVAGHRTLDHLLKPWEPNLLRIFKDAGYRVCWAGMKGDTFAPGVSKASTDRFGFTIDPEVWWHPSPFGPDHPWFGAFYHGQCDGELLDHDEAAVRTAEDWLDDPPGEPWVLFVALLFPHPPFEVSEPWFSLHDRGGMPDPLPPLLEDKPRFMRRIRERYGLERLGPKEWAEIAATYFGMVSRVDDQLGRLLDRIDEDRTVVAFFTDHGEYLGDYGLVEKWPAGLNDCLVRDPLIIRAPGHPSGGRSDALVEMIDVLPTLCELAGVEIPHPQFGRSLVPLLHDPSAAHRHAVFSEGGHRLDEPHALEQALPPYHHKAAIQQEDPQTVGKAVAVRTERWTYVRRLFDTDELYDRVADPGELINLSGRPDLAEVERELRDIILDWVVETADVVPLEKDPRLPLEG